MLSRIFESPPFASIETMIGSSSEMILPLLLSSSAPSALPIAPLSMSSSCDMSSFSSCGMWGGCYQTGRERLRRSR
jgi:hypothetical protein